MGRHEWDTDGVPTVAALVRQATAGAEMDLERTVIGSGNADEVAETLCDFVASRLAPVAAGVFYRRGTGIVLAMRLRGGRPVVVKVHRWRASVERLSAVQAVQREVARCGLPAPLPLLPPEPLGRGIATVEEMRPGDGADGHHPAVRRHMAEGLEALVRAARPLRHLDRLGAGLILAPTEGGLWPVPHDLRFDFDATSDGAEWIDELWRDARACLTSGTSPSVVGHLDWRTGNLGFAADRCTAIYDWDSVGLAPEPVIAGAAGAQFSVDWSKGGRLPTVPETAAFLREYEACRGHRFEGSDRELLEAAIIAQCAYGARCQHSDLRLGLASGPSPDGGWIRLLREWAAVVGWTSHP